MDGGISFWGDFELLGLPVPEQVQQNWLVGRDTGHLCDDRSCRMAALRSSASLARMYARLDREFGDRPGRAYWLAFARSRREIASLLEG